MDINEYLESLDAKQQGDYLLLYCPECGHREAYVYVSDIQKWEKNNNYKIPIRCNRLNKCGKITYLNDQITSSSKSQKKTLIIKEENPIQINEDGLMLLQQYCRYVTLGLKCNTAEFDFDIRGISNKTLKENNIIYSNLEWESIINKKTTKHMFGDKYRSNNYKYRDIIIPIYGEDGINVDRLLLRSTYFKEDNYKKEIQVMLKKGGCEIWNLRDLLNENLDIIFITEGVYDALSVIEVNEDENVGVVSLPGVGKYKHLLKYIKDNQVLKDKTYVFAFDNDKAGEELVKKATFDFYKLKVKTKRLSFKKESYKDCNEFLQSDRNKFTRFVKEKIEEIKKGD